MALTEEQKKAKELKKLKRKRYLENKKKKWFDSSENPYIYVQGLPLDVDPEELALYFKKCGILKLDPISGEESIKIYTDDHGIPKGDARLGFAKLESVETAVAMLDGSYFRPENQISVKQAEF